MSLLVAIINHNHNKNAIKLMETAKSHVPTCGIDSGSELTVEEHGKFDLILPNLYYTGQINGVHEYIKNNDLVIEEVLIIASDVVVEDMNFLVDRTKEAFKNPDIGIYAPSVNRNGSNQRHMINRKGKWTSEVAFVDGFCFAVKVKLLNILCPIDLDKNLKGWGIDVFLGYLNLKEGWKSIVDHQVIVFHTPGPNKNNNPEKYITEAKLERKKYYSTKSREARRFLWFSSQEWLKNFIGVYLIKSFFKKHDY